MEKLRVFEAFAGVGSQSMALRNVGVNYEIVGTMDVDKWAILAYDVIHNNGEEIEFKTKEEILAEIKNKNILYNFSTGKSEIPRKEEDLRKIYEAHIRNKNYGDIRKVKVEHLPDFDFFTYSFPCKNISNAGQQAGFEKGKTTQSALVWECERVIKGKMPSYLMMENVKNIVGKNHKATFDEWCGILNDIGYNNYWKVLNGKNYGVPQNRQRVIMISIRKDIDNGNFYLPETNGKVTYLKDILEEKVDNKYYIDESKYKGFITKTFDEPQSELLQCRLLEIKGNESTRRIYDENGICPTLNSMNGGNRQPKILVREATKKGYAVAEIGDSINLEQPNSKTRRGRVGHGICNTLTTSCNQGVFDTSEKVRKLTELECWRVQGFLDEDFYKAKEVGLPSSKLYERAGRGIVVPMLEEIFKILFKEYINDKRKNR